MNSRTSRPRSPTRQMTLTSAVVERAIMPSSDDLPTPEPAKMPRRWPRPQGTSASSARTPSDDALADARALERIRRRRRRPGARGRRAALAAVDRAAEAVEHAARAARRRRRRETGWPVAVTTCAGADARAARRAASAACGRARKPTTSAAPAARPRPVSIAQTSPTSASRPVASTIRPIRSLTRPWRRCRSARATASPRRVEALDAQRIARARARAPRGRGRAWSRASRRPRPRRVRTMAPPRRDAALGLDLAVLDAAELAARAARRASRTSSRSSG